MAQTDLKSDAFCIYNQSAQPLKWTLAKDQYYNTYSIGTIGINPTSNFVRPDVINIDSYLSGRDDILSKCNPPLPALDEATETPLTYQNQENTNQLQPFYTREPKSAVNLSAVTYLPLTFSPELFSSPQNLNHIIFQGQAQRGGLNTSNLIKSSWNSNSCENFLDPQRACGKDCSEVNGYMTRLPHTPTHKEAKWGKLPSNNIPQSSWFSPGVTNTQIGKANAPQRVTSQQVISAGAADNGPQQVVPTTLASPGDKRNEYLSFNQLPGRGNPYAPPPNTFSPLSNQNYISNTIDPLVAQ